MTRPTRVYCVITGDLFHHGHVRFFNAARHFGNQLIVGVCNDEDVSQYKRSPIMSLQERCELISSCRYVNEVIPNAPPYVSRQWITQHQLDAVVTVDNYTKAQINTYFRHPRDLGILKIVPYTEGISTSDLIRRCYDAVLEEQALETGLKDDIESYSQITQDNQYIVGQFIHETGFAHHLSYNLTRDLSSQLMLSKGDHLLDINCEFGGTAMYCQQHFNVSVDAYNSSTFAIKQAESLLKEKDYNSAIRFHQSTNQQFNLSSRYQGVWVNRFFSASYCKTSILNELKKYMDTHGRMIILDFFRANADKNHNLENFCYQSDFELCTASELLTQANKTGFRLIVQSNISKEYCEEARIKLKHLMALQSSKQKNKNTLPVELLDDAHRLTKNKIELLESQLLQFHYMIFESIS